MSYTATWLAMQAVYTPTPRSEIPGVLEMYKSQNCTTTPNNPTHIVAWENNKLKYKPLNYNTKIVLYCP